MPEFQVPTIDVEVLLSKGEQGKECAAIAWAVLHLRNRKHFIIITFEVHRIDDQGDQLVAKTLSIDSLQMLLPPFNGFLRGKVVKQECKGNIVVTTERKGAEKASRRLAWCVPKWSQPVQTLHAKGIPTQGTERENLST